jgi:hypothetical protein
MSSQKFTLAEIARITTRPGGARLVANHPNWCAAAETGHTDDCQCNDAVWLIVPAKAEVR